MRKQWLWTISNILTVHSAKGQVRDEDLKNKNMIMLFQGRIMAYLEEWNVTDVKTVDMVLCSLIWTVTCHVGAKSWMWSYTWMMRNRGNQNISLHCRVTHHESCLKSWRSKIMAPWWVAIIILLSHGMVTHINTIAANICQQMNELPALECWCSVVYSIMWMHSGLHLSD